jgi:hypothetical protein
MKAAHKLAVYVTSSLTVALLLGGKLETEVDW